MGSLRVCEIQLHRKGLAMLWEQPSQRPKAFKAGGKRGWGGGYF